MRQRATAGRYALGVIAFSTLLCTATAADATSKSITLDADSDSAYGVKTFVYNKSIETDIASDGTLSLIVVGDFDEANETLSLDIDGANLGVILAGSAGGKCAPIQVSFTIPQSTLKTKAADGAVTLTFTTSTQVSSAGSCDYGGHTNISAYLQGSLAYTTETLIRQDHLEETVATSESLAASRRSVTLANLPSLSGRLGKGFSGFQGAPGGGLPGSGLPAPSAPAPSLPGPSSPVPGGSSFPGSNAANFGAQGLGGGLAMLSGSGGSDNGALTFSGDLRSLRQAAAARFGSGDSAAAMEVNSGAYPIDVWFGGSYTYFDSAVGGVAQSGDIATVQFGVDSRLDENWLVGVAAFGDLLVSDVSTGSHTSGLGFMTGPYVVASIDGPLTLEALAAVGRAYNRIETSGQSDARYASDRLLLTARLSGDWSYGGWSFRPSTRATYYAEKQEAFADGGGSVAPEATSVLGQLRFGPEVGYELHLDDIAARPFVGAEGVWAFRQSDQQVNGVAVGAEDLTGGVSFGLDGRWGETTFRAGGRYEGLGDPNLESVTAEFTVRMALD